MDQLTQIISIVGGVIVIVGTISTWIAVSRRRILIRVDSDSDGPNCSLINLTKETLTIESVTFRLEDEQEEVHLATRDKNGKEIDDRPLSHSVPLRCSCDFEANAELIADTVRDRDVGEGSEFRVLKRAKVGHFRVQYNGRDLTSRRVQAPDLQDWIGRVTPRSR